MVYLLFLKLWEFSVNILLTHYIMCVVAVNADVCMSDVLIRISRCHSEGCDTKVYGVKAVGLRYVCHC